MSEVKKILNEAVTKLNKLDVKQLKAEAVEMQIIIDLRNEIKALGITYDDHRRRKL